MIDFEKKLVTNNGINCRIHAHSTEEHNAESTSSNNLLCPGSNGNMLSTGIRLITATEAAQVLHVSRNAIYTLWRKGLLDFWSINGTRTTNLRAIGDFLEKTRNMELQIEKEEA